MELKDDGVRREYGTGAVRDTAEGKGRCDLLPLDLVAEFMGPEPDQILIDLETFQRTGDVKFLKDAIFKIHEDYYDDPFTATLELAKHYEDGARKYADRNWEKGIPIHCYVDSAVRHYLKLLRGDTDEPHDRALLWNLYGAWWTMKLRPDMNDLPVWDVEIDIKQMVTEDAVCETKNCENRRYANVLVFDEPCDSCVCESEWMPKEEVSSCPEVQKAEREKYEGSCCTCVHNDKAEYEEPCDECNHNNGSRNNYVPQIRSCGTCKHLGLTFNQEPCKKCGGPHSGYELWGAKE